MKGITIRGEFLYLHIFRGIHHKGSHNVRAVRLVPCPKQTHNNTKVKHILIRCCREFEIVMPTTLNDWRIAHFQLRCVYVAHILFVRESLLHT